MKRFALILALLPVPALAAPSDADLAAAYRIAKVVTTRCATLVLQPGAEQAQTARVGVSALQGGAVSLADMAAATDKLAAEFEKTHGVALRRSKVGLCKAGEAEIKSGTAIGRMLKRK